MSIHQKTRKALTSPSLGLASILFAATISLSSSTPALSVETAQNQPALAATVSRTETRRSETAQPPVLHAPGSAEIFAPEPEIFGFGAETDDMIVTRDLSVRIPTNDWFYAKTNLLLPELFLSEEFLDTDSLMTRTDANLRFSIAGKADDDSYIISVGSNQPVGSLSICAGPELIELFKSLPESEMGCGVAPVESTEKLDMKDGTALLVADRDMEIALKVGTLKLAEGSVVLISNTEKGAAVFDFHDPGKGKVALVIGDKTVALSPGRHLHATSHPSKDFAEVNGLDMIGHRRVSTNVITGGVTLHSSEFSTLSAMELIGPLKKVMASSHPEARKLAQQMIKTSAVLMHLGAGASEDFKPYGRTRMTSLVNKSH